MIDDKKKQKKIIILTIITSVILAAFWLFFLRNFSLKQPKEQEKNILLEVFGQGKQVGEEVSGAWQELKNFNIFEVISQEQEQEQEGKNIFSDELDKSSQQAARPPINGDLPIDEEIAEKLKEKILERQELE